MTTRETIRGYFDALEQSGAWQGFLADGMVFTSFTTPIKRATGKGAFLEATKRFYSMIKTVDVRAIVVEGEKACALTRYELQAPGGAVFESHVAEAFTVRNGKIESFEIYFDSAPFPK